LKDLRRDESFLVEYRQEQAFIPTLEKLCSSSEITQRRARSYDRFSCSAPERFREDLHQR